MKVVGGGRWEKIVRKDPSPFGSEVLRMEHLDPASS